MTHDEIRALLAGTTPGEWTKCNCGSETCRQIIPDINSEITIADCFYRCADAAFIAASKSIVEQLLEENESQTKRIVEELERLMEESEPEKRYFTDGGWQAALYKAIERIKGLNGQPSS